MALDKKIFLKKFHDNSMGTKDHQGVANLDPSHMVGRIYVRDHYILLHTKYISCGPHGFIQEDF